MQLKRQFGLWTAIALIVGQVIAVGIFLTPAGMAKTVASPFWLLVVWLVIGALTLCGALCYAELAARFPEAGGSYVYLREAFGAPTAFVYGWMVLLVLDPGLTAIFAVGLTSYVDYLVPLAPPGKKILAIACVFALAICTISGARASANLLKILTVLKVGTLVLIVVYGFGGGAGDFDNFTPFFRAPPNVFAALAGGTAAAFFAFAGWWEVARAAGEVENPQRNLPLALVSGVAAITIIYIATSAVFWYLVPPDAVTNDQTFAAQAGERLFGAIGGKIFALVVIVSVAGTLLAYLIAAPRVYYAMAADKLFFPAIARLHPRFQTPHRATLIQASLASVLILLGTFEQILSYFFFVVVLFLALTVVGLFRLRRQPFDGYKTPLFPVPAIVFLILTAAVLTLIALQNPLQTVGGVLITAVGLPVYKLFFARR